MTTGLERKAHRLVELARSGDDPSAAQLLSLHGAVAARIAAEGAIAASTTTATGKAAGAGALVKGLVVAGAVATGAAGFFALQPAEAPPAPVVHTARSAARRPAAPPPVADQGEAAPAPAPVPAPEAVEPPAPTHAPKPAGNLRLQDEAALLAEVQGALRSGQAQVALGKLETYDRRFPGGMLRPEAEAARVFALCAAGKVERARSAAARFATRFPSSPALARVQAACK
jgi:hypothetical protein